MEKKEIRKKVLDIRNRIPAEIRRQKSMEITDRVCKMSCFLRASSILIYRNFRSEVETGMLIEAGWEMGKEVFCPRVEGKEMEFYRVKIWEDFEVVLMGSGSQRPNALSSKASRMTRS